MARAGRLSSQAYRLLDVLAGHPSEWLHGLDLAALAQLKSGSLYSILIRLADHGLLQSRWLEPREHGQPPRHVYRITAAGLTALAGASRRPPLSLQALRT